MLEARHLSKRYFGTMVVYGVDLRVGAGVGGDTLADPGGADDGADGGGARHTPRRPAAGRSPGDLDLRMCWAGEGARYLSGVKRAGWLTVVLPTIAVLAVWHLGQLGPRLALLHAGVGTAVSLLLTEVVFFDYRGVALASTHQPVGHLQSAGFAVVVATLGLAFTVARLERSLFDS